MRTSDPHLGEQHIVVDRVADDGTTLLISGSLGTHTIDVVLRRVG